MHVFYFEEVSGLFFVSDSYCFISLSHVMHPLSGKDQTCEKGCYMSLVVRKPVFGGFDQDRHKPGCTATEDGQKFEISDLGSRRIVLSV